MYSKFSNCYQISFKLVSKEANFNTNNMFTDELKKWAEWARKKADWYDPSISLLDESLGAFGKKKS